MPENRFIETDGWPNVKIESFLSSASRTRSAPPSPSNAATTSCSQALVGGHGDDVEVGVAVRREQLGGAGRLE